MFNTPDNKPDFSKIDEEITKWWQQNNTFQKSIDLRDGQEEYIFYDGPPFMSGMPHYATLLSSMPKDVIPRYQTMKGKKVERLWGWDCHGLPIENKVEQELNLSTRKEILEYGLEGFINKCYDWNRVGIENWRWYIDKIGRWADIDNAYRTMDQDYMESVWWVFKEMWDKGLVYKGKRTSLFSTDSSTPVSSFEVAMDPDNYRDTEDLAVTVKFKLTAESNQELSKQLNTNLDICLLAWTTTPWTLPSNFALAVNPSAKYIALQHKEEVLVMAKDLVDSVMEGLDYQPLKEITSSELVGLEYQQLLPFLQGGKNDFKVYASEYVTIEDGTGILHVAPAFGEADFEMGQKWDLSFSSDIDEAGNLTVGPWQGTYLRDANPEIANHLDQQGLLLKQESYMHRLPYYRYANPLIYKAQDNYFVNVQQLKKQLFESNEDINWVPDHFKDGRFKYILETAPDWSISRSRFWGTPMPIWEASDGSQIVVGSRQELLQLVADSKAGNKLQEVVLELDVDCKRTTAQLQKLFTDLVASTELSLNIATTQANISYLREQFLGETHQEAGVKPLKDGEQRKFYLIDGKPLDLHRPFIDKVTFTKGGKEYKRIEDTLDVWMDSGSMPFAQFHYPFVNKEKFEASFPGDFICEYTGQIRAWFYVLHVISNAVFSKPAFKNVLVTGVMSGTDGRKMSKSYGNYPDPKQTLEKYGGDALRLYFMGSPIMMGADINFSEEELQMQTREFLIPLWNIYKYFVTYANIYNWQPTEELLSMSTSQMINSLDTELDKWMVLQLDKTTQAVDTAISRYNTPQAVQALYSLLNEISKWYIRRSRDRFGAGDTAPLKTLYYCLSNFVRLAAPIIPFTTEEIYKGLVAAQLAGQPDSVHLTNYPSSANLQGSYKQLDEQMEQVRIVCELGQSIRTTQGIKVRQPLATLQVASSNGIKLSDWMQEIISEELNVQAVEVADKLTKDSGWIPSNETKQGLEVSLYTNLNPELEAQGLVREIIRTIQAQRKASGLDMTDKVEVSYASSSKLVTEAVSANTQAICEATGATGIKQEQTISSQDKLVKELNGHQVTFVIQKV